MKSLSLIGCAVVLVGVGTMACGGQSSSDPAAAPSSEDALTSGGVDIPDAVAAELTITPIHGSMEDMQVMFGSEKRFGKLKKGLKKASDEDEPAHCNPNYTAGLKFFDVKGAEVGSTTIACGFGSLKIKGQSAINVKSSEDYVALSLERPVPADALWGVDSVVVKKNTEDKNEKITEPAKIKKLLDAIDGDQKIDDDPLPKCRPVYSVQFKRGSKTAGWAGFMCVEGARVATVRATFGIGSDETGGVRLNPRPFEDLF